MPQLNPVNKFFALQEVCESNYRKLLRLIPRLPGLERHAVARPGGKPALHLRLVNKAPYTLTLELSYRFGHGAQSRSEPALKLRVYLDVGMVEVLGHSGRPEGLPEVPVGRQVLERKWFLNYFLDKWLDHCLHHGYRFVAVDDPSRAACVDG